MLNKIFAKDAQYLLAFILYLFCVNCQGPLEGENIEFLTPNIYKDLSPKATRIVMRTEKSNWTFHNVQYNDTIADLASGRISKINHGEVKDTSFSYETKQVKNQLVVEITGSFFTIRSESPENKSEPTVITVDITENTSNENKVLLVQLINLDTGSYFRIEQNPR